MNLHSTKGVSLYIYLPIPIYLHLYTFSLSLSLSLPLSLSLIITSYVARFGYHWKSAKSKMAPQEHGPSGSLPNDGPGVTFTINDIGFTGKY